MKKYFLFILYSIFKDQTSNPNVEKVMFEEVLPNITKSDSQFNVEDNFIIMTIPIHKDTTSLLSFSIGTKLSKEEMNDILWYHMSKVPYILVEVKDNITINGPIGMVNVLSQFFELNIVKEGYYDIDEKEMNSLSIAQLNHLLNEAVSREDYSKCTIIKSIIDQKQLNNGTH